MGRLDVKFTRLEKVELDGSGAEHGGDDVVELTIGEAIRVSQVKDYFLSAMTYFIPRH